MADERLTAKQVQEIIQAAQGAHQAAQDAKQIAQEVSQSVQNIKGSQQEKSSMTETKQEEINSGEGFRHQVFVDSQLWALNKKLLSASEQSERTRSIDLDRELKEIEVKTAQVELARKEHNFANQQKLDNLSLRKAEDAETFKHILNMEYAKFNAAASHPVSPNNSDENS